MIPKAYSESLLRGLRKRTHCLGGWLFLRQRLELGLVGARRRFVVDRPIFLLFYSAILPHPLKHSSQLLLTQLFSST